MTNTLLRLCCVLVLAHSAQDSARTGARAPPASGSGARRSSDRAAREDASQRLTAPEPTLSSEPTLAPDDGGSGGDGRRRLVDVKAGALDVDDALLDQLADRRWLTTYSMEYASTPAPTELVSFNVIAELRIVGLSCAAYGTAEEAALGGALADVLEFVTEDSLTDSECVDVLQAYSYTYSSNATNASCVELYNVTRDLCTWTTVDSEAYSASTACQEACSALDDCFAIQWHADGTEGWCDTCTGGITLDEWAATSGDANVMSVGCFASDDYVDGTHCETL